MIWPLESKAHGEKYEWFKEDAAEWGMEVCGLMMCGYAWVTIGDDSSFEGKIHI